MPPLMHALLAVLLVLGASSQGRGVAPELLERARWVEGRVVWPANTPADERLTVVAHAHGLPAFNDHGVQIGPDGGFRVAFAHDARRGRLELHARYAVQEGLEAWKPDEAPRERTLVPELGAWLSGRVRGAVPGEALRNCEILLAGRPSRSGGRIVVRRLVPGPDGVFEAGGLATDRIWSATITADRHQTWIQEHLTLERGRHAEVAWTLARGATISGRVVDELGNPLAHARLAFECRDEPLAPLPLAIADGLETRQDGSFEAGGLYVGDVLVRVELAGYVPRSVEFPRLVEGEIRAHSDITLTTGVVVRGRVLDPSGAPASAATVIVAQTHPGFGDTTRQVETGPDGTFSCSGGFAPARVRIESRKQDGARRFHVVLAEVDPVAPELVVRLVERFTIHGRVLDDAGRTILAYTAGVRRHDPAKPDLPTRTIEVANPAGAFVIDDLDAGSWEVFAFGRGIVWEPARVVELPTHSGEVVFVLRRPAVVSGVVKRADGSIVARAVVDASWERPALLGGAPASERTSVTTSPEGKFELTEVYPGRVTLRATAEDGKSSLSVTLDLGSGEKRGDVSIPFGP